MVVDRPHDDDAYAFTISGQVTQQQAVELIGRGRSKFVLITSENFSLELLFCASLLIAAATV